MVVFILLMCLHHCHGRRGSRSPSAFPRTGVPAPLNVTVDCSSKRRQAGEVRSHSRRVGLEASDTQRSSALLPGFNACCSLCCACCVMICLCVIVTVPSCVRC